MQKSEVSAQKLFQINKANNGIGSFQIADGREGWHNRKKKKQDGARNIHDKQVFSLYMIDI